MYLTEMYKIKVNGYTVITGNLPIGAEVLETLTILNAEDGYDLVRIATEENVGANVWLKDGDTQENYKEVEHVEPEPPVPPVQS